VSDTDGIDQILSFATKLKAGPAAVAVTDGADLLVCGLELFCAGFNLWEANFLGISPNLRSIRYVDVGRL